MALCDAPSSEQLGFIKSLPPLEHLRGVIWAVFWVSVITVYIVELLKDNRENIANSGNERIQNISKQTMCTREEDYYIII